MVVLYKYGLLKANTQTSTSGLKLLITILLYDALKQQSDCKSPLKSRLTFFISTPHLCRIFRLIDVNVNAQRAFMIHIDYSYEFAFITSDIIPISVHSETISYTVGLLIIVCALFRPTYCTARLHLLVLLRKMTSIITIGLLFVIYSIIIELL